MQGQVGRSTRGHSAFAGRKGRQPARPRNFVIVLVLLLMLDLLSELELNLAFEHEHEHDSDIE
jgi:hypothetical protein